MGSLWTSRSSRAKEAPSSLALAQSRHLTVFVSERMEGT